MDFKSLIGLEESEAKAILLKNGYNNIEIKINAKHNENCDTHLVCAVKENDGKIILICGEFYLNIKG